MEKQDNQVLTEGGAPIETKKCGTCELMIDASKFRIHEIGCARNNYKCPTCGDIVAKAEREEHEAEAHTKIPCKFCKVDFDKRSHEKHELTCFMKPKECRYCEQLIEFEKFENHVGYCGSRTKKCLTCGRNVCFKDEDSHFTGGECEVYREEDLQKRLDEQKRKE